MWQTPLVQPDSATKFATNAAMFFSSVRRAVRTSRVCDRAREPAADCAASFIFGSNQIRCRGGTVNRVPRFRGAQPLVHILNVLHALIRQPVLKSVQALLRVHRNSVLPRRAAAEDA